MKPPSSSADVSSPETAPETEDYSIYAHIDHARHTPPWKLGNYGQSGALSSSEISELRDRFDLPEKIVRTLSVELGHCLSNEDGTAINLLEVSRSQALDRGRQFLQRLMRRVQTDPGELDSLKKGLAELSNGFSSTPSVAALLPRARAKLADASVLTPARIAMLKELIRTPGAVADMSPRDRRKAIDKRRQYIVETCCYAWMDAGRPVTYTTNPAGGRDGQRQGRLIEFIQAVGVMVTAPTWKLSGETIRKDIDHFRDELASEDSFWDPPEFGN